jgi:hypothetical protein
MASLASLGLHLKKSRRREYEDGDNNLIITIPLILIRGEE